jgi:hypothetical protein
MLPNWHDESASRARPSIRTPGGSVRSDSVTDRGARLRFDFAAVLASLPRVGQRPVEMLVPYRSGLRLSHRPRPTGSAQNRRFDRGRLRRSPGRRRHRRTGVEQQDATIRTLTGRSCIRRRTGITARRRQFRNARDPGRPKTSRRPLDAARELEAAGNCAIRTSLPPGRDPMLASSLRHSLAGAVVAARRAPDLARFGGGVAPLM